MNIADVMKLIPVIRRDILVSTTTAGSGHASSSLSAVELAAVLFFRHFRFDLTRPENPANDRFILSKGHASPLLYSLCRRTGVISEAELLTLRKSGSRLEGHPRPNLPFVDAATGSLGQGLSVGIGMSLAIRLMAGEDIKTAQLPRIFVLMGDGEIAEGQVWEALQLASLYKLNNIVVLIDVNRLGQTGPAMSAGDVQAVARRFAAFDWRTYAVPDGHDPEVLDKAFDMALTQSVGSDKPAAIIVRTVKGKGVAEMEDREGWHGIPLPEAKLEAALAALGSFDADAVGIISQPVTQISSLPSRKTEAAGGMTELPRYAGGTAVATRKAFGEALSALGGREGRVVLLDGDMQNSTHTDLFAKSFPDRFFQMYIAEQNMVSVALGLSTMGFRPFVATFGAFLTRAHDQIRLAALSGKSVGFCGSHAGVSVGEDGPTQMGLEDLAMFRAIPGSTVLYPADAVSAVKLTEVANGLPGISYIRTTRPTTPVIYTGKDKFVPGGSHVFYPGDTDKLAETATVVAAGITLYEAFKAQKQLVAEGIGIRVIDCYSIKPIDAGTLRKAADETGRIIVVEDHYPEGGLGEAVLSALSGLKFTFVHLAVRAQVGSGKPAELMRQASIDAPAITQAVHNK